MLAVLGVLLLGFLAVLLLSGPASAATVASGVSPTRLAADSQPANLPTVINNATRWLVGISAVLATFFLTMGGVQYLMAGGDPSQVERAKGSFRNAGIGYALAMLAPVILNILQSILGIS